MKNTFKLLSISLGLILFSSIPVLSTDIELGKVNWLRNLKTAQIQAKQSGKPILMLFQEVPGCSTCKNYGSGVLSNPLIVEAIESYFIPLCIHNNKNGADKEVLLYFKEPSWNNPVVRIIDSDLHDLFPRLNGDYTALGLVTRINATFIKKGVKIPNYLDLLEQELRVKQFGSIQTTLGMYCFWSGEKTYGQLNGVISTNAGFMESKEVVQINFDPNKISLEEIIEIGKRNKTADRLYSDVKSKNYGIPISKLGKFQIDTENKYYLYNTDYKYIPMTAMQATKLNASLAHGKVDESILSPRQLQYYKSIRQMDKSKLKNQIANGI